MHPLKWNAQYSMICHLFVQMEALCSLKAEEVHLGNTSGKIYELTSSPSVNRMLLSSLPLILNPWSGLIDKQTKLKIALNCCLYLKI